jgi:hypothetical protein
MEDGYWRDQRLTSTAPSSGDYALTTVTVLELDSYQAGNGITADRFFVRAFAETLGDEPNQKPPRYAFSNPIWIIRSAITSGILLQDSASLASLFPVRSACDGFERRRDAERLRPGDARLRRSLAIQPELERGIPGSAECRKPLRDHG